MINERLRDLLADRNLSIGEFAEMCDLPFETVRNIYYGRTTDPKVSTLMKMSRALGHSVNFMMGESPLAREEGILLEYYRMCGNHGKSLIELVAKYEATTAKAERESMDRHKIPCLIANSDIIEGIDYERCEVVEIETAARDAFTAIKLMFNDLVPAYCKGDVILLENRFPRHGENAVFFIRGRAFIRKFLEEESGYRLKCLHRRGEDFLCKRMDQVEYIGTCIGVVRE
ncbi:MAG: helix-turn-helix domain-containing protein [Lachnospiraceae bacterium]|nr:helix-turn-helix domain-containing protein [Lachnospiraceae bacterium]